jgi:hypothetical protein
MNRVTSIAFGREKGNGHSGRAFVPGGNRPLGTILQMRAKSGASHQGFAKRSLLF